MEKLEENVAKTEVQSTYAIKEEVKDIVYEGLRPLEDYEFKGRTSIKYWM